MGFHWDTPDYWVRSEVDEMLWELEGIDVGQVLDSFQQTCADYDGGPDMAAAVIGELRRRATAGVPCWPALEGVAIGPHGPLLVSAPEVPAIDEDDIPW